AAVPFCQGYGYALTLWVPLAAGSSVAFVADSRSGRGLGDTCRSERCTLFLATPAMLEACAQECDSADLKSLRFVWCGGGRLPQELAEAFGAKVNSAPREGYGGAEMPAAALLNVPDQVLEGFRQAGHKPGTLGQPLPGVAARIVDPNTWQPVAPGQEGLLLLYGPSRMLGYVGRPERTQEVFHDGWYITGERGRMDEDGFVALTATGEECQDGH